MAVNQSLTLLQVSQNIAENTSRVRILWQSTQTGASYNDYTRTATWWLRVNGGTWSEHTVTYTLPKNQTANVVDVTLTVQHSQVGDCLVEAKTWMDTDISAGIVQLSQQLQLSRIPRYSQITATDANIGSVCTVRIQKASSAYKHSLRYSLTGAAPWTYLDEQGNPSQTEVIFGEDTVEFTVPERFYEAIPAAKTGICTLECWTYITDSQYLPQSRKTTFTYTADPQLCGPDVDAVPEDTNTVTLAITGSPTTLVRYVSSAQLILEAQAHCGATILDPAQDVSVWHNGQWYNGENHSFPYVESDFFKLWTVDSRGYTAYKDCFAREYIPYVHITNQTVVKRLTPTGSSVSLTVSGGCYNGSFGGALKIQNIVRLWYRLAGTREGLKTAQWYEFPAELSGNTYTGTVQLEDIPYDGVRWVETWSQDKLQYVTKVVKIGAGVPVFDWGENDFSFHVPVAVPSLTVNGMELDAYIKSVIQGGVE